MEYENRHVVTRSWVEKQLFYVFLYANLARGQFSYNSLFSTLLFGKVHC